jgi:hypothetical protein
VLLDRGHQGDGDLHLVGQAVAVDHLDHRQVQLRVDPLHQPGDERAVPGRQVEVAVLLGPHVERVGVVVVLQPGEPAVLPVVTARPVSITTTAPRRARHRRASTGATPASRSPAGAGA